MCIILKNLIKHAIALINFMYLLKAYKFSKRLTTIFQMLTNNSELVLHKKLGHKFLAIQCTIYNTLETITMSKTKLPLEAYLVNFEFSLQ